MLNVSRSIPCNPTHRSRHKRAVSTLISNSRAMRALDCPCAAANTMRARSATCCSLRYRLLIRVNVSCSFSLSTTWVARFGMHCSPSFFPPILSWILLGLNVLAIFREEMGYKTDYQILHADQYDLEPILW